MSEFIVIAPSDYVPFDIDTMVNATGFDLTTIGNIAESQQYSDLNESMRNAGIMPDGVEGVTGLKLVEDRELYLKFD